MLNAVSPAVPGGFILWFTGLSGSGKSTLSLLAADAIRGRGRHVELLDGDEVRTHLSAGLGFSREDRDTNIRRIGYVARLLSRAGACAITAAIGPYRETRDEQRRLTENFIEVHCDAKLESLVARDPKGLYRRALAGDIRHFTGIDDPYEAPLQPEVTCKTDEEPAALSLGRILAYLEGRGLIAHDGAR